VVRPRPLRIGLALVLLLLIPASPAPAEGPAALTTDRKPYAIRADLAFDPSTRIDGSRRASILDEWLGLARRFVGEPWSIRVVEEVDRLATSAIEELKPDDLKGLAGEVDKVWAIRVRSLGAGFALEGRELDVGTGWLGEVHRAEVGHPVDLPRGLLRLASAMFAPSAEVGESKDGGVSFLVRGGSLPAASPIGEVAPVGTIFRALRIFPRPDGSAPEVREVPYSYFRVARLDGPVARCEIIRGVGDPLTGRYARKNTLVAIGIKPGSAATRLRFLLKGDRQPAAGYRLIARSIPPGSRPIEAGTTDREGRVVLPPGFAEGLVSLRLMAGNDEPMLDVPVMPGETAAERTLVFEPRPQTLALEAKLEALRDAIIDVVAARSRLELRMKARGEGEDWAGLDQAIAEFRKLTPRDQFQTRLDQLRQEGEQQEAALKTTVLTRNARAQLDETKNLIGRYLDDEVIRSYEDAALRARAERAKPRPAGRATTPPK
jgi:hypothetical protein